MVKQRLEEIHSLAAGIGRPVKFMEVCGTHTMSAFRSGLRSLLPRSVSLLSGPGCPVCVTPNDYLDTAIAIARQPETTVATFGDMVRVPGTDSSLEIARAQGANLKVVYSPGEALQYANDNRHERVAFLGVGFETTAPAIAWTIAQAAQTRIDNYVVLCGHKTIPPAMVALGESGDIAIDGFMCPGHVSVIIGAEAYVPLCGKYAAPCVVTGFEPSDMVHGIEMLLRQVAESRADVEIQYSRCVDRKGNTRAQEMIDKVFEPCDAQWRGLGTIPGSGLRIRDRYAAHDAQRQFADLEIGESRETPGCICGQILRGVATPYECPLFGAQCTPETPVGACMVSSEGTCAAYYKYARSNGVTE